MPGDSTGTCLGILIRFAALPCAGAQQPRGLGWVPAGSLCPAAVSRQWHSPGDGHQLSRQVRLCLRERPGESARCNLGGLPSQLAGRGTDAALLSFRMATASARPCSGRRGGSAQRQRARALCSPLATAAGSVVSGRHGPIPPPRCAGCPGSLPLAL